MDNRKPLVAFDVRADEYRLQAVICGTDATANRRAFVEVAEVALERARARSAESRRVRASEEMRVKRLVQGRRRLLACLDGAFAYKSDETQDAFVRGWARRWRAAAKAWRMYAPTGELSAVVLPEQPEYEIAQAIFRLALRRAPLSRLEAELAASVHDLLGQPSVWSLRYYFEYLREYVVQVPVGGVDASLAGAPNVPANRLQQPFAEDDFSLWELRGKRGRHNEIRSVSFVCLDAEPSRPLRKLNGTTAAPLVIAVASQAGQGHRWDDLSRVLTSSGVSTCAAITLQRTGRRLKGALPEALRPLWNQSKSGVRLEAEVESADVKAGVVRIRVRR